MERKRLWEIVIAIVIILLLIVAVWWLLRSSSGQDRVTPEQDEPGQGQVIGGEPLDLSGYEQSASTIARVFVERFGSFSNGGDYQNIDVVMDIATDALQARLQDLINTSDTDHTSAYYGISTHVLSIHQVEVSDRQEVLEVLVQREESIDSPANTSVKYQTIRLTLVKDGTSWLVDDFIWLD